VQSLVDMFQVFLRWIKLAWPSGGQPTVSRSDRFGKDAHRGSGRGNPIWDARAVIKVDCAEFQHSHEIAKLIGSPPGYLGHRETHPLITQEALAASHTEKTEA